MEYLNVSQVNEDASASDDICQMEVADKTYNQISRMPFRFRKDNDPLMPGDVMIDLVDEHDDLISESPLVIPPHSAVWLLETFFKAPKKIVRKVKLRDHVAE